MYNPDFIKGFNAGAVVRARRFVVVSGAADLTVVEATGAAAPILGISGLYDTPSGDLADVTLSGIAEIVAGGAVTRGQRLTSNANGEAVAVAPAAGANASFGAMALRSAVAGDIVPVFINQGVIQG